MKDDFYKDIEHKRASKEEKDKSTKQHSEEHKTEDRNFSRAERHKPKEKDKGRSNGQQNERLKEWRQKFDRNINKETLEKGKAFFAGKLSSYNKRVRDELKVSKEKLSQARPARKVTRDGDDGGGRKGFTPTLIAGILILPVTIILGVLIISNFWPTDDTSPEVADNAEETTGAAPEEAGNDDLQDQKAELERELAESRNETGGDDLGTGSVEFEYSEEEQSELEAAASTAIEDKASGEATDSSTSVVETPEEPTEETEVTTEEAPEETTEEPAEETTEEAPESSGGTTHVVRGGDNVYRIALRYYGSGSAENVSKILDANGVTADSLSVGQELVIPE
ncbi:LysM peptidoglycan-binding domain-containing protein [Salinicoccus hispanicus]|uniref:LysM peptidoglycan-binding domain-containing protein n=1 Tax=Salinicoccus hispanicus TaxID=157225 RepID=A0A6N8TX27_9STAP|nr:LysM peptidoglycan-binding domain-containing protein [Salinicoccus hispanicus]MXQ50260.1 LysM peptidoglycan-binding domain-containing protein [Salinicoccus hispanicus]